MYGWKEFMMRNVRYKKPFLINAHEFTDRPSYDGTLPTDPLTGDIQYPDGPAPEILSDTSDEVDS